MSIYTLEKKIELALKACYSYAKADASIGDDYHKNKIYAQRASIMEEVKSYMAEVIGERDLEIQAVKNAFTVKGVNPEYHDKIKRQLAVEWPTLYYALESLTYSAGLSQPATRHGEEGEL